MHINRGLLFWGLALITAGVVALATRQGLIDEAVLADAWQLWPVVLIAIGLSIVLSRTPFAVVGTVVAALVVGTAGGVAIAVGPGMVSCGGEPGTAETKGGEFTLPEATVYLELSCGSLDVAMTDGSAWQAATSVNEDGPTELEATDGSLDLRSGSEGFPFSRDRAEWALSLGRDVAYDLSATLNAAESTFDLAGSTFSRISLDPNAGSVDLDLSGAQVSDLRISLNAGSVSILTDGESDLAGLIGSNAGSVELCAPEGAALRFTVNANVSFSHNLDESDLVQSGDTFTSPDFESADHGIDLRLQGNAANFNLNPEEGCQ